MRNQPTYFQSEAYELAKKYSRLINKIIIQRIDDGEIRKDIPRTCMRDIIIGSIERACMIPAVYSGYLYERMSGKNLCKAIIDELQAKSRKDPNELVCSPLIDVFSDTDYFSGAQKTLYEKYLWTPR